MRLRSVLPFLVLCVAALFPADTSAQIKSTLSWDPVTAYSDGVAIETGKTVFYEVLRGTKADLSDAVKVSPADHQATSFQDTGLTPNKTYFYTVNAYLSITNPGLKSDPVSLRTFPPGKVGRVIVVSTN